MKNIFKEILTKLPIFLFCVFFISMHNKLFGTCNSIIGVILLVGLFMFMRGNLGFKTSHASISIFIMFIVLAICPKISLINPFLGLFVNLISIFLILVMSSHDITVSNHITFMMGYIFCQGYDVSGRDYGLRVLSLILGGIVIALIYFLVNRKQTSTKTIKCLFNELDIHSMRTQWYIRLSLTLAITILVCDILKYPRTMWISLTILSLTIPSVEEHRYRGKVRIPAAVIGTAVFFILFQVIIPVKYQPIIVLLAGFGAMFIKNYFIKSIYNSFSSLGAAVLLFDAKDAIWFRIVSNIIGTIISVISHIMFNFVFKKLGERKEDLERCTSDC